MPPFTIDELQNTLKKMPNGKCADGNGITLEFIKYGPEELHSKLLSIFNQMLQEGKTDDSWRTTLFRMLPKSGDLTEATNWRPIAILQIFYKIFSKMLHNRIHDRLEAAQAPDQCSFRLRNRIKDVIGIAETIISGGAAYAIPSWIANLDLKKAFDRIEHLSLFDAIRRQGTDGLRRQGTLSI